LTGLLYLCGSLPVRLALLPVFLGLASGREMLLERGIVVSYETIRRRCSKFGLAYVNQLGRKRPSRDDIWHLDEVDFHRRQETLWSLLSSRT
jgi:transposase-like protein